MFFSVLIFKDALLFPGPSSHRMVLISIVSMPMELQFKSHIPLKEGLGKSMNQRQILVGQNWREAGRVQNWGLRLKAGQSETIPQGK